jgi:hypothetical protein|tara:strand:+ start:9 stop:689 length:681 start_codon:yes stop_codon:yes gene_type:complete
MLKLGLALSLSNIKNMGGWKPTDESSLVAWYQNKVGITLNGSDVSQWADSSSNSHDMVQATASEQPAYDASTGNLNFVAADTQNLQTTSQISLTGAFTIGIKFNPDAFNTVLIADNTTANEFIKATNTTRINIKIDGTNLSLDLDSGTIGDGYILITRNGSNLITLYHNGVAQSGTGTVSGTSDIDCIGARKTDTNPYDGDMSEIQIYNSTGADLVANVKDYFDKL